MRIGFVASVLDQNPPTIIVVDAHNEDRYTTHDIMIETFPRRRVRALDLVWFRPMAHGGIGNVIYRGRTPWIRQAIVYTIKRILHRS